jgi:predicted small lipoprotein YifL
MKRHILHGLVVVTALLALSACGSKGSPAGEASASATPSSEHGAAEHKLAELSVDQVETRIAKNDGKTFVYDNNHPEMYRDGHGPGAKLLAINDIPASAFPADKDATLIFYCANTH